MVLNTSKSQTKGKQLERQEKIFSKKYDKELLCLTGMN